MKNVLLSVPLSVLAVVVMVFLIKWGARQEIIDRCPKNVDHAQCFAQADQAVASKAAAEKAQADARAAYLASTPYSRLSVPEQFEKLLDSNQKFFVYVFVIILPIIILGTYRL